MLIHPTVERLRALGLTAMADAFIELQNTPDAAELPQTTGSACSSIARRPAARTSVSPAACARPSCARPPSSRTSTSAPTRPRPGPVPQARHLRVDPRASSSGHHRPDRYRQVVAGLRARPQGLPRGLLGALQARPRLFADLAQARGEGRLPRLMTHARTHPAADHRRLGAGAAQRRAAPRSARDRRRSLRPGLAADHQPGSRSRWHEVIGDPTLADAILDRIIHIAPIASSSRARACAVGPATGVWPDPMEL